MEQRIINYVDGVAVVEEVNTKTVSKADILAKKELLANKKAEALQAIDDANKTLDYIANEEIGLAEQENIIAQAEAKFVIPEANIPEPEVGPEPEPQQTVQPAFDGGF